MPNMDDYLTKPVLLDHLRATLLLAAKFKNALAVALNAIHLAETEPKDPIGE